MSLAAPLTGWLMSIREVPDPVFSEGLMGEGFAVDPVEGRVSAPCAGLVLQVASTKHSITLRTDEGAEILIHVGLETVALGGEGFETHVREGDPVRPGDLLITFDMDAVGLKAKSLASPVVLTNTDEFRLALHSVDRLVAPGETIGVIESLSTRSVKTLPYGDAMTLECVVGFEHGLHARPAARVADAAKRFTSDIKIIADGKSASARSAVALMALDVHKGDRVSVVASGVDRDAAARALCAVLSTVEQEQSSLAKAAHAAVLAYNEIAGVCAVPGVALGTAFRWRRKSADIPEDGQGAEHERKALEGAIAQVSSELRAVRNGTTGAAGEIADAHLGLLDDENLRVGAAAQIEAGRSAAYAWTAATSEAAEALRKTGNPRMQERVADLEDIAGQLVRVLTGTDDWVGDEMPDATVLLAEELLPSEILSLDRQKIRAIAVEGGGATSHMAIIAGSIGVPTLVAVGPKLADVAEGTNVLVDSAAGKLVINPADDVIERALKRSSAVNTPAGPCRTRDGTVVRLLANIGGAREVDAALAAGAEGCGLLRTEFLFLDRAVAPSTNEQADVYQTIADAFAGRPLTIRTLDIGGDKPVPFITFEHEENPALGARGIRTKLIDPELIDAQLQAIARVRSDALKVMIPMVSSVDELRGVRARLRELGASAALQVGAMVETPAAALLADTLAKEADFLSIGTNDLAQYALAMDRTNPLLAGMIDALHPAVLRLIALTTEAGAATGTPVSVCGNLASDPVGAVLLIGFGITELSGAPAAFSMLRRAISQVTAEECRDLARRALQMETAGQVRALASEMMSAGEGA
jgi:multiphosphoryl transfer protein